MREKSALLYSYSKTFTHLFPPGQLCLTSAKTEPNRKETQKHTGKIKKGMKLLKSISTLTKKKLTDKDMHFNDKDKPHRGFPGFKKNYLYSK